MFPGPLGHSLAGKALAGGVWALETVDIRTFARDKHRSVDDTPFGGGPGMVVRPDVVDAAIGSIVDAGGADPGGRVLYLSPRGRLLDQALVRELAQGAGATLLCGRYEGLDERVIEARGLEEVSLGDFVLSGGEPAAICVIDAVVRLLPGALGDHESAAGDSHYDGLLSPPSYTRPPEFRGAVVPEVLLSGNHAEIAAWRVAQAERLTRERRPDLWARYVDEASN
jgi:tRNA (guanine37-N1)-methyltransferase